MASYFAFIRYALPILGLLILIPGLVSLLKIPKSGESMAYLQNILNGDLIELSHGENSVGRSKICDIIINYPTVSRLHAVISYRKGAWHLTDTHSSTGTTVNGKKIIETTVLKESDSLAFGGNGFVLKYKSETADVPMSKRQS